MQATDTMTGLTPDDIKTLQSPLPLADHEAREKGLNKKGDKKQYLIYINQEGVIPLLNRIDPNWTWDVQNVHFEAKYVSVTGRLSIKGVARDGVGGNSPNGASSPVDEDTVKGAETDALKRAALRFGVGLYLRSTPTFWIDANLTPWDGAAAALELFGAWYKREFGAQKTTSAPDGSQRQNAPQNAPSALVGAGNGKPDPKPNGSNGSTGVGTTAASDEPLFPPELPGAKVVTLDNGRKVHTRTEPVPGRDVSGFPIIGGGKIHMIELLNKALAEKLVREKTHFSNQIDKCVEEGLISDPATVSAEQVLEAMRAHVANKDLQKEGAAAK